MMSIDDTTKVKIWQDMYKQAAWERDVAIKQLEQLGYEFGEKIETNHIRESTKLITEGEIMDKIEIVARNYSREDCDVNMLKRLAEDIYISGFKRGIEKEKLAKSKTVTNSHDFDQWWSDYITSHTTEKDTDENASNKVVNYKPGDKFILELGQERRMFGEFEIKGTDLYVRTDLLEKLTQFEPEEKLDSAQPERKTGRWIKVNGYTAINCSACYHCSWSLSFEDTVKKFSFCPNCGAKMLKDGENIDS